MAEEPEKFPRLASDLVDWLDEFVSKPEFPMSPQGVQHLDDETIRLGCFQAGARNLVDQLITWRAELEESNEEGDSVQPEFTFDTVFTGSRNLDQTEVGVHLDDPGSKRVLPDEGNG